RTHTRHCIVCGTRTKDAAPVPPQRARRSGPSEQSSCPRASRATGYAHLPGLAPGTPLLPFSEERRRPIGPGLSEPDGSESSNTSSFSLFLSLSLFLFPSSLVTR